MHHVCCRSPSFVAPEDRCREHKRNKLPRKTLKVSFFKVFGEERHVVLVQNGQNSGEELEHYRKRKGSEFMMLLQVDRVTYILHGGEIRTQSN